MAKPIVTVLRTVCGRVADSSMYRVEQFRGGVSNLFHQYYRNNLPRNNSENVPFVRGHSLSEETKLFAKYQAVFGRLAKTK